MTTINEISNHIMSYFDGTLDAFGYTAQSVNEISNPDESYMGTLNLQFRDYPPSQVEAIIFGIPQLTPEHQDYIITGLKKHLREFIQDEEQDEDMISQYTATYNALEKWESDKRETQLFDSLAASELIRQLNK